ncbi:hypothetical protein C7S18_00140 [Ahniella affigens]|uniref:Uncharacterized protein n=1 Tax=Ahniella affigens TaxID=2021234 RepID=A0A2P1PLH0_9GAMM|nr:tetratricopeptide repeat protein [Ahniella affigens]AVP95697.1 hypothetical protein C7S18_00140 [Ahniella affigens]
MTIPPARCDLPRRERIDVLLLTAVKDERDVLLRVESDWEESADSSGFTVHFRRDHGGLHWALARAVDMGPEFASNVCTRLVTELRPRCVAMAGVCAGWRKELKLGDVVVAERLFRYDAGKLHAFQEGGARKEEVFQDIRTYNIDARWRQKAEDFPNAKWAGTIRSARPQDYDAQESWLLLALDAHARQLRAHPRDLADRKERCPDWTKVVERLEKRKLVTLDVALRLTEAGRARVQADRDRFPDGPPAARAEPVSRVAPMATGSRVVEDAELFPTLHRFVRKTLGVDMEGSAVAAVAEIESVEHCLVVKGVQDHADSDKDDRFREYAIEASYRFLVAFLRYSLEPARVASPFVVPQLGQVSFTGRQEELRALEQTLLGNATGKICTIAGLSGSGGIGKSALAVRFADVHRARFPDGVVGLRVDGKHVDAVAREFARTVGEQIDREDDRDAAAIMQSIFADRAMLLIFDNAEDAAVRRLVPGGRCAVIVTTRDRGLPVALDVPVEARIDVPPLPVDEAVALLRRLVGPRVDAESSAALRLVGVVGAMPLALQIVCATLQIEPWRTLESLAEMLEVERERLSNLKIRGDQHLDVRVSFTASLRLLRTEEIDFFACLGSCAADGFSPTTAGAVAGGNASRVSERLGYLHRLSLLNRPQSTSERFVLHPLLRDFARELAVERGLHDDAVERHACHFAELIEALDPWDWLAVSRFPEEDMDDALLAAQWIVKRKGASQRFLIRLQPLLVRGGYWLEAVQLITDALEITQASESSDSVIQLRIQQAKFLQLRGDFHGAEAALRPVMDEVVAQSLAPRLEAMALNSLAGVLQRQGKFDDAADAFRRSHELLKAQGDERGQAMVLNSLGGVLQRQGKFDEAADALKQSAELEDRIGNERGRGMVLNSLGGVLQRQGKFDEAADALKQSAELEDRIGNERGRGMVLNSLGGVLQRQGKFDDAADAFRRSMTISEQLKDERGLAMVLNSLGGVLQRQGKFDDAADAFRRSMTISEQLKDERGLAMVLNSLGGALQRQGKFDDAADAFRRSMTISEQLKDERGLAMVLNSLGGVLQRQGKFDDAADAFRRSMTISEQLKDERSLAMALNSLGGVLQRQGKFDDAADAFRRSVAIGEHLDDRRHLAMVLNSLGGVLQRQGKFDDAADAFRRSMTISEQLKDERGLVMVLNSLGGVLQRQGKFDDAADAFRRSMTISEQLKDELSLAMVLNSLGGVLQRQGKFDDAADAFRRSMTISEQLKDERGLAMVLNSLGGVLQRQGKFDDAADAFRRSMTISELLKDERSLAMALNSLGGVLQRQGKFGDAADAFRRSVAIGEHLDDRRHLAMALNSLGGVLQRQGKFHEAADALRRSHELLTTQRDERGQAMVLNSLGGVLQRLGSIAESDAAFRQSIEIGERLRDSRHLAKARTAFGKALVTRGVLSAAIEQLKLGLELDLAASSAQGLAIVAPILVDTLRRTGAVAEAAEVIRRALAVAPGHPALQKLSEPASDSGLALQSSAAELTGRIKRLLSPLGRPRFGFITIDGGTEDIYFREPPIPPDIYAQLSHGTRVAATVTNTSRGKQAISLRILPD